MTTLNLNIHGHIHALHCDDGEEAELRSLASALTQRLKELDAAFNARAENISAENTRLVIVALTLLSELRDAKKASISPPREEVEMLIATTLEKIAARIEKLAA